MTHKNYLKFIQSRGDINRTMSEEKDPVEVSFSPLDVLMVQVHVVEVVSEEIPVPRQDLVQLKRFGENNRIIEKGYYEIVYLGLLKQFKPLYIVLHISEETLDDISNGPIGSRSLRGRECNIIVGFNSSHLASNYSVQSLIFWLKTAPVGESAVEIDERGLDQLLDAKNDLDLEICKGRRGL